MVDSATLESGQDFWEDPHDFVVLGAWKLF